MSTLTPRMCPPCRGGLLPVRRAGRAAGHPLERRLRSLRGRRLGKCATPTSPPYHLPHPVKSPLASQTPIVPTILPAYQHFSFPSSSAFLHFRFPPQPFLLFGTFFKDFFLKELETGDHFFKYKNSHFSVSFLLKCLCDCRRRREQRGSPPWRSCSRPEQRTSVTSAITSAEQPSR